MTAIDELADLRQQVQSLLDANSELHGDYLAAVKEAEQLRDQLPEGMKHCTILFKECEKGHGWLTATNWVQHCCPTCERDQLRAEVGSLKQQRDNWKALYDAAMLLHDAQQKRKERAQKLGIASQIVDGEFPEGCTPADARVLREANHALAAENDELRARVAELESFVTSVAKQTPEQPDYWSSCGQCSSNISDAEELMEANQIEGGE